MPEINSAERDLETAVEYGRETVRQVPVAPHIKSLALSAKPVGMSIVTWFNYIALAGIYCYKPIKRCSINSIYTPEYVPVATVYAFRLEAMLPELALRHADFYSYIIFTGLQHIIETDKELYNE